MSEIQSPEQPKILEEKTDTPEVLPVGEDKPAEEIKVVGIVSQRYSGPIPHPDILRGFEEILPGSADRIIRMAEKQSEHRQEMEKKMVHAEDRDSLLGVIFAFLMGLGCLGVSLAMVLFVPSQAGAIAAAFLGVTGIASITGAFIKNTRSNREKEK